MKKSNFPIITVCIPVYNEERYIGTTIDELLQQDYPTDCYEIIVADGGSTDKTREIVREIAQNYPHVILLDNPGKRSASGRNVCFKNGRGDIFLVVDGHCKIDNQKLLKDIVACFEKSGAQCLARPQPLNPPGISDFQKAVAFAREAIIGHSIDSFIYSDHEGYVSPVSHGAIYKKEVFEKTGYVDESFDACEDVEFNYRVKKSGFTTYMSPDLSVKYYPRENIFSLFKQMTRYGFGRVRLWDKHPEAFSVLSLVPFLFVIGIFLTVLLFLLNLSIWKTFGLIYLLYLVLISCSAAFISISSSSQFFKYLIPIFFTIHFGLGWGIFVGVVKEFVFFKKISPDQ